MFSIANAPSAADLDATSDTGTSNSDDITYDDTPTLNLSGMEAGASFSVDSDQRFIRA